jgi:hypothetical protein
LQAEQGLGDIIQFARYPIEIARRGARVLLAGPGRLASLLSNIEGLAGYVDDAEPLPDADFHVPLISLPHHLKSGGIGADEPYLCADPQRIAYWRARLDTLKGLKIGLAWQGNVEYEMDYARSIPALLLAQLLEPVDAHLVVLQQGYGSEQIDQIAAKFPIVDLGQDLDKDAAFVDTAAIMANLDLIITSDTSIPHLRAPLAGPFGCCCPSRPIGVGNWAGPIALGIGPCACSASRSRAIGHRHWNKSANALTAGGLWAVIPIAPLILSSAWIRCPDRSKPRA